MSKNHFLPFHNIYFCGFFLQNGSTKSTFDHISGHFRSIGNFNLWRRRSFWISEIHFRLHFWPFQIDTKLYFLGKCLTKWLPSAILDVRNSLSIAFLAISDQYATLLSPAAPKARDGRYCNAPRPSVHPSVRHV